MDADSKNNAKIIIKSAGQAYSLQVEEIGHITPINVNELVPIPQCAAEILGLTAQGGRVITVLDLSALLHFKPAGAAKIATLITLEKKRDFGLLLGEGCQILTSLPADNIESETAGTAEESTAVRPLDIEELISRLVEKANSSKGVS